VIGVGVVKRKKVAVSACLLGEVCRYDDISNEKCPKRAFSMLTVSF